MAVEIDVGPSVNGNVIYTEKLIINSGNSFLTLPSKVLFPTSVSGIQIGHTDLSNIAGCRSWITAISFCAQCLYKMVAQGPMRTAI